MNNIFSELSKLASLKYNSETSSFVTKKYFRLHSIGARSIFAREIAGSFDGVFWSLRVSSINKESTSSKSDNSFKI